MDLVRSTLDDLIKARGENYSSVSRLLGRNAAYIQQFIQRGTPRVLDSADIATLARHFEVPPSKLGGIDPPLPNARDIVLLEVLNPDDRLLRVLDAGTLANAGVQIQRAAVVVVQDDLMKPTLASGDEVVINRLTAGDVIRDGLYALRVEGAIAVRRIALEPRPGQVTVICDHPQYPQWSGVSKRSLGVIGRVCWIGKCAR